jgi:hypothetical protein
MRRRRLLLVVGLLVAATLGIGLYLWITTPRPGVTRENFRRLRVGMTLQEAEEIMGGRAKEEPSGWKGPPIWVWRDGPVLVGVFLDEARCVTGGLYQDISYPSTDKRRVGELGEEESALDRLRRLLPW